MKPKFLFGIIIFIIILSSCKQEKIFPPKDEIKAIAEEAYIFGLPYVLEYRTMYMQAVDKTSESYVGFGKFLHYGAATAENKDVMTPNRDTPYSWVWVDLRTEPWVLTVPKIDSSNNRYYTIQWNDLAGFVVDNVSALTDGYDGGNYLIAPPNWKGELPEGVKRMIQGETSFMAGMIRTELFDDNDMENVKKIQEGYTIQPLSQFLGQAAPKSAPEIVFYEFVDGETDTNISFFDCLSFLLQYNQPNPIDKPILDKMAKIGIMAGAQWSKLAAGNKDLAEEAASGMRAMIDALNYMAQNVQGGEGGEAFGSRSVMGNDYMNRAKGAYLGLFGNTTEQAIYINIGFDEQNQALDASKYNYTFTFTKEEIPQVKFFWSLTMYNMKDRYLVANPINRYSIGTHQKDIQYNADGSLTLYIQKDNPGNEKESNWLPAPDGIFYVILRQYGPSENARNTPIPAIIKMN